MHPTESAISGAQALRAGGKIGEAVELLRRAARREPRDARVQHALAAMLFEAARLDEAAFHADRAVELLGRAAGAAAAGNLRGAIRHALGDVEGALAAYDAALNAGPAPAGLLRNRGRLLHELGRVEEACAAFGAARDASPRGEAAVTMAVDYAQALNYAPSVSGEDVFRAHAAVGALVESGAPARRTPTVRAGGPIRVGYLSGDFRTHSVAYFFEPLLAAHDAGRVRVTCYATSTEEDAVTARLRGMAAEWRTIARITDDEAAARIEADGIDVLVDLAGLTVGRRLGVLARRPSPVVCTFLGYPNTTGLSRVDYRLVDAVTDPPELDGASPIAESRWRLDRPVWSWRPPAGASAGLAGSVTRSAGGAVTFASFNTVLKYNRPLLEMWGGVLARVPGSRLLLKGRYCTSRPAREAILSALASRGVSADRVELIERTATTADHLALYGRVDVALDTYPYHGTTTTCEALWMGVPVVTLEGRSHASRVGVSLLRSVAPGVQGGVEDLIARTPDEFAEKAAALAGDAARRESLRRDLPGALLGSPVCDAAGLARALEEAYAGMLRAKGFAV